MRTKRGITQIDWIVSTSLFLLYLFWFFLIIKPQITYTENTQDEFTLIIDQMESLLVKTASYQHIFIPTQVPYVDVVYIPNRFGSAYSIDEIHYKTPQGLFFEADLKESMNLFEIYESDVIINGKESLSYFYSDPFLTKTAEIEVQYVYSRLDTVAYGLSSALQFNNRYVDGQEIREIVEYNRTNTSASYVVSTNDVTFTDYYFASTNKMYKFIDAAFLINLTESYTLYNIHSYSVDKNSVQQLSSTVCENTTTNQIHFVADEYIVSFVFDNDVMFTFCNDDISTEISFNAETESLAYMIDISSPPDFSYDYLSSTYSIQKGPLYERNYIDYQNIQSQLDSLSYNTFKQILSFPSYKDFSVSFETQTQDPFYIYGPDVPLSGNVDVFAKSYILQAKDGAFEQIIMRIKVW